MAQQMTVDAAVMGKGIPLNSSDDFSDFNS